MLSVAIRLGFALVFAAGTASASTIFGDAEEVASDVVHPNGNIYDQVLLRGSTASVRADAGQVTRVSFLDTTDDIIQVEFAGAGLLTVTLENASGPMTAAKYNQPDIRYMRGHASITISGSDASTNLSIFSVGRLTAINRGLFRDDIVYDGFADLARVEILRDQNNPFGSVFGSIRTGNVHFFATQGNTGIYVPDVQLQTAVIVGDISAYDDATPMLWFGTSSQFGSVVVAGGDLEQPNGRPIQIRGFQAILMKEGTTSPGVYLPTQGNLGRIERDGSDVTNAVVLYPVPTVIVSGGTGSSVMITIAPPIQSVSPVSPVPPPTVTTPTVPTPVDPNIIRPGGG